MPSGKPVKFTPFYGALAHAIFFRDGSLDYFHSHICGSDPACSAGFGTPATTGRSTKPGRLELGVLLPGDRALAAVPPGHPPRQAADRAVYAERAMRRREHAAGLLPGTRARASRRSGTGLRGHADAARGRARRPAPPGDRRRRAGRRRAALVRRALARRARRARASCARARARPGAAALARPLRPRQLSCSAAARSPRSPRSRPGSTRAPACTCTGGSASTGPCTATRCPILLALSLAAAARSPRSATSSPGRGASSHVLRRLLLPRAAIRPQPLAVRRIAAPSWLLARALRARGPPALSLP